MNERIEKLSNEAYLLAQSQHSIYSPELLRTYTKQFAELIVRECIEQVNIGNGHEKDNQWDRALTFAAENIKEHFGVE